MKAFGPVFDLFLQPCWFVTTNRERWLDRAKTAGLTLLFTGLVFGGQAVTNDAPVPKITMDAPQWCMAEFKDAGGNKTWKQGLLVENPEQQAVELHCPLEGACGKP